MLSKSSCSSLRLSVALFASAFTWAACGGETRSVAPGPVSVSEVMAGGQTERPEPGSPVHREQLEQRVRMRFEQRREAWIAEGKPDAFITFMEQALERRIHDIRNQPFAWFTTEAIKERSRQRNEAAARLFLREGYSPKEVTALVRE